MEVVRTGAQEVPELDWDSAETIGRNIIGRDAAAWKKRFFEAANTSCSRMICPAEWVAAIHYFSQHLGRVALNRLADRGIHMHMQTADMNMEGRISEREIWIWGTKIEEVLGVQTCVLAAARYLGMREAEGMIRRRVKNVEFSQGFAVEPSMALLTACVSQQASSSLYSSVCAALDAKADPNAALYDPFHNGFTPLICLAMTPPTVSGNQVALSIDRLMTAGADPYRESGTMPFGRWTPLRFAAFMQNEGVLNAFLKHDDMTSLLGNRFLWAASENIEYIMLEEIERRCGAEMVPKVQALSRYDVTATVLLQQYASPVVPGNLTATGVRQLIAGEFKSGSLPRGCKANPDGPGLEGITALMDVAKQGDIESAKALLRGRADPNRQDSNGATALHHAASWMQVDMVRALLHFRADPHLVDHAGFSAWMLVGEEVVDPAGSGGMAANFAMRSPSPSKGGVSSDARRELLEILRPPFTAEELIAKLKEDWSCVVDESFFGPGKVTLDSLKQKLRLHESLFFSSSLADGHGAHEGRRERVELLDPMANIIIDLLRNEHLEGDQKTLTRYLLQATMGPSQQDCKHVHTPWPTADNRATYRESLTQVAQQMLSQFADECDTMRKRIEFTADMTPSSFCAKLRGLPADKVTIPESWLKSSHPDHLSWNQVQQENMLRFDPAWALQVDGRPTRACLALLRMGAVEDLAAISELIQVHHSTLSELFARGWIRYSELCNVKFQEKMKEIALRAHARCEGLDFEVPKNIVPAKKLKRLMEKIADKRDEMTEYSGWAGRSDTYFRHSMAFYILDTVRTAYTCNGKSLEKQVECAMRLIEEFKACTPEKDGVCVLREKNGFAEGVKGSGGYADVKLLVYADLGTFTAFEGTEMPLQIVGEVQIILKGYMEVKHKMHLVYEVGRGSFDHKKTDLL